MEAQVRFDKDASGQVNQLTIHQNGRDVIARKISNTVPAPPQHQEISVSADKLKEYAGKYALTPGFILTIALTDDHLEAQATNQPKVPIFPEAPDKFFYKVVEAQLEFHRDASGIVSEVTLHQGGRSISGRKQ